MKYQFCGPHDGTTKITTQNIRLCGLVLSKSFRRNNFKLQSTPIYDACPENKDTSRVGR